MKPTGKRTAKRAKTRQDQAMAAGKFLRQTFYFLKGEHLLKASSRVICEAH